MTLVLFGTGLPVGLRTQTPDPAPILAATRAALGGESRLSAIRTFVAAGRIRRVRGKNLVPIEFEIACAFPDRYVRQDEIPAEETGLMKTGFNREALIQDPSPDEGEKAGRAAGLTAAKQDFARWMLALLAQSFPSYPLTFSYAGRAEAPEGAADVIDAKGRDGFAVRLFIDRTTHLPVMLAWQVTARAAAVEHRWHLSSVREVDGVRLPFLIRRAVAGETVEETTFDRFRINTKIDPRKFEVSR